MPQHRIHQDNINTAEWFNHVWKIENVHRYDVVRLRALLAHVRGGEHVLDVGAGWYGFAQYGVHHGYNAKFTALDFSIEARRRTLEIMPSLDYRIGDALALPFPDASFDIVGSGELIEHMEHPEALVAEMARVCRPGGWVMISTLDAHCEGAKRHGDYPEHLWQWDQPDELLPFFTPHGPSRAYRVGDYFMVECHRA